MMKAANDNSITVWLLEMRDYLNEYYSSLGIK